MAAAHQFDLFVLGAGSGGVRASRIAAKHGARVAICEEYRVGGTCVMRGCIPKKILVYASHHRHNMSDMKNYGWTSTETTFDWPTLIQNKEKELDRLNNVYKGLLSGSGVKTYEGTGKLVDEHTVQVGDEKITAGHILIATGSSPHMPNIPGIEHVITSNEALELPALPKRVAIVGGGYIACEFAGIFNGCGSKVTQLYRGDLVLRGFDEDCRKAITEEMAADGIDVRLNTNVTKIEKQEGEYVCHLDKGEPIVVDTILYATGRKPNTHGLNLDAVGVKLDSEGAIIVDETSQTSVPSIYAVGDVTNRMNLTPVALGEGHAFADTVFGNNRRIFKHENIACAVFSQPPLSCVGLNEAEAKKKYNGEIDVYVSRFTPLKHTISKRQTKTFMKLIVARESQRVIGCHMVGDDAPEIVQGLAIAVVMQATKSDFDATVGIHPTAAEEFVTMRTKRD